MDSIKNEDVKTFKDLSNDILRHKVSLSIEEKKQEIKDVMMSEEEEAEVNMDSPEIALDPKLEKEIWIDSFEINGKTVVIKALGLGATKPVVVYIDDVRWEVFPGPKIAKREARRHIKKSKSVKNENLDVDFESMLNEVSVMVSKPEVVKWVKKNRRKFDNGAEAAFADADEFGMEDELENEKHWIWSIIKKIYKESYEPFSNMLESNSFRLADNTKINLDEELSSKIKLVYEHLEDNNKAKFREAFVINKENHNKIIKFVEEQTKGT